MSAYQPTLPELIQVLERLDWLLAGDGVVVSQEAVRLGCNERTVKRRLIDLRRLAGPTYVDQVSTKVYRHLYKPGVQRLFNPSRGIAK